LNAYRRAGWISLIPLPYGKQDPPPSGYTGRAAKRTDKDQLMAWIAAAKNSRSGTANLAIVHGPSTIAIDVDHYSYVDKKTEETKEKRGGDSLAALEEELGPLPLTWRSTARGTDNPSGQRFFRLAPEHATNLLDYDDKPGPHIEIVRWGHRYSVVWPSLNGRRGEIYRWYRETTEGLVSVEDGVVPEVSELPLLPESWVVYLTRGLKKFQDVAVADLADGEEDEWVLARPDSNGQPCKQMQRSLEAALEELPGGAHDAARDRLMHMMWLAWEGHAGLATAASKLREAFLEEVSGRRSSGAAAAEWYREYRGAVARAAARTEGGATACACFYADAASEGGKGALADPAEYERNDDGNAEHLLDLYGEDLKWVEGFKSWMVWDEEAGHWQLDTKGYAMLLARNLAPRLKTAARRLWNAAEAQDDEAPEKKRLMNRAGELMEWARQAGMRTRLTAMLDVAKSYEGVTVPMGDWDMKPEVLICKGGTLELLPRGTEEGVRWRESRREDLAMLSTNLEFVPWSELRRGGAGAGLLGGKGIWEDYLETFLPAPELRWFVQRLLGYSLLGANPERKLVFFQGPTSTGKSTILEAVSAAMGRYGGTFNLSMFRESQDAGPRPDLVVALPRRLVVATESDSDWNLNADTIKRLVGGTDKVQARNLHSNDMVERIPAFMPVVASNSAPTINGADAALWRRLVAVPFDRQIPDQDNKKHIAWELANRLDCKMTVLSWLVEGYIGYAREGITSLPEVVEARGKVFRAGVSDWHSFMSEALEYHPSGRVQVADLYDMYRMWGMMNDIKDQNLLNKRQFEAKLTPAGYAVSRRKTGKGDNKANFVIDWRLKTSDDAEEPGLAPPAEVWQKKFR
jgi:P4 family phage/plasmid primase-like protien